MSINSGFERVYEIGSLFRSNKSRTSRHTTEFTGYDIEMAYIDNYMNLMQFEEDLLIYCIKKVQQELGQEIKSILDVQIEVPTAPFPRIQIQKAKKMIGGNVDNIDYLGDLSSGEEVLIGEIVEKEYNNDFVFITNYPYSIRPFYHMKSGKSGTMSFDLLYKGIEITTGAQREHRYDVLLEQAKEKDINTEKIGFYLNSFKYASPPHGGMGIGPARIIMKLLKLKNIDEATFFPTTPDRLSPD